MTPLKLSASNFNLLKERILAAHPDLTENDQVLWDTVDGESDLAEVAEKVLFSARMDRCRADALDAMIGELAARQKRFLARAETMEAALLDALQSVDLKKPLETPSATIGLAKVPAHVIVTDESKLDWPFVVLKHNLSVDKRALGVALKAGQVIEGATMSNGGTRLNVKVI